MYRDCPITAYAYPLYYVWYNGPLAWKCILQWGAKFLHVTLMKTVWWCMCKHHQNIRIYGLCYNDINSRGTHIRMYTYVHRYIRSMCIPVAVMLIVLICTVIFLSSGGGCDGQSKTSNCTGKSLSETLRSACLNITCSPAPTYFIIIIITSNTVLKYVSI